MSANEMESKSGSKTDLEEIYFSSFKDIFHHTLKDHHLVEPLRRTILVGNIEYSKRHSIRQIFDEIVRGIQQDILDKEMNLTGILIIHENFFYLTAESSDETLCKVIETTAKFVDVDLLFGAKVIRSCTVVVRYFSSWYSCVVNTPSYIDNSTRVELNQRRSGVPIAAEMVKKLEDVIFVLSSFVRFVKFDKFESKINELLATGALAFREDILRMYQEAYFLTVGEYVQLYLNPQDYTSYLEGEWPPSGPVHDCAKYFEEMDHFEGSIEESILVEEKKQKRVKHLKEARMKLTAATAFKNA